MSEDLSILLLLQNVNKSAMFLPIWHLQAPWTSHKHRPLIDQAHMPLLTVVVMSLKTEKQALALCAVPAF